MQLFGELWVLAFLPDWAAYFIVLAVITWAICMVGVVLGKTGRSPLWALLAFLPAMFVVGLWILALGRWPREPKRNQP